MPSRVILMWGQSNAYGENGYLANLSPAWSYLDSVYPKVKLAYDIDWPVDALGEPTYSSSWISSQGHPSGVGDFGPDQSLARSLGRIGTGYRILKSAQGNTNLHSDWSPTKTTDRMLWNRSTQRVIDRLGEAPNSAVAGMVWIQGVNDAIGASEAKADEYGDNLIAFVAAIRALYGSIPFVFNQLHEDVVGNYVTNVRAGQVSAAASIANSTMVNMDDLTLADQYHFDSDGFAVLGARLGAALTVLLPKYNPGEANQTTMSWAYKNTY